MPLCYEPRLCASEFRHFFFGFIIFGNSKGELEKEGKKKGPKRTSNFLFYFRGTKTSSPETEKTRPEGEERTDTQTPPRRFCFVPTTVLCSYSPRWRTRTRMPMVGFATLLGGRPGGILPLRRHLRRRRRRATSTRSEMVFCRPSSFARDFCWRRAALRCSGGAGAVVAPSCAARAIPPLSAWHTLLKMSENNLFLMIFEVNF